MAIAESKAAQLNRLNEIWEHLGVEKVFRVLKDQFEKPAVVTLYKPGGREIVLPRPYLLATYYRQEETPSHLSKSDRRHFDETDIVYKREYALALGATGFYTRYRDNGAKFLEDPSKIHRSSRLQSLLEADIKSERGRKPDWITFLNNIPLQPKR